MYDIYRVISALTTVRKLNITVYDKFVYLKEYVNSLMDQQDRVKWIYTSKDNEELEERYDQWAKEYDEDLLKIHGYQGPEITAEYFKRYVALSAKILDIGAGTGLTGAVLARLGYENQVAVDLSKGMLEVAQKRGVYQELYRMVLGETLDFPTDFFDAAISTGLFTQAHAPAHSFDEIVRIVKPGGYIVFTLLTDSYKNSGFKEKFNTLESEGKWKLIENSKAGKLSEHTDVYHQIWVFQIL